MKKRAFRRFEERKKKVKARKIYPHDPKARLANHLKACSCWMCGNPRKFFKDKTIQEKRFEESIKKNAGD